MENASATSLILDYSDAVEDDRFIRRPGGGWESLFGPFGWCPHCKRQADLVKSCQFDKYDDAEDYYDPSLDEFYHVAVWKCQCGWWDVVRHGITGHDSADPPWFIDPIFRHAILKSYGPDDPSLPVLALRRELTAREDLIHAINDRKMEELVGAVLSDYIGDCTAHVCGRSGDGGIDIILVEADTPIAVQVKRRMHPGKTESVRLIREFITAMRLKDIYHGLYVTSAEKFSLQARQTACLAVEKGLVFKCELVDKSKFLAILESTTDTDQQEPWQKHFLELMEV